MQTQINSQTHAAASLGRLLASSMKITLLLGVTFGVAFYCLSLIPDHLTVWSTVATVRPEYVTPVATQSSEFSDKQSTTLAKFLPTANHEQQVVKFSPATWTIAPRLKASLLVEHWFDVKTETVWEAPTDFSPQNNLRVVGFHLGNEHYCFAQAGLLSIYDAIYSFTLGTKQIAVSYWAVKDRVRVLARSSDTPVDWGIVGMTNNEELVVSIDGECFQHDADLPFEEIQFEETTLAAWTAKFPDTRFCPCRVESL